MKNILKNIISSNSSRVKIAPLGPVMVGPSSSHTAGAARLGSIARELWGEEVKEVDIYLRGSFAATYWGHGTDKALVGGLMGWYPDDSRIRDAFTLAKRLGMKYRFYEELIDGAHPNSVRFVMKSKERKMEVVGASIGGGTFGSRRSMVSRLRLTAIYPHLSFSTKTSQVWYLLSLRNFFGCILT